MNKLPLLKALESGFFTWTEFLEILALSQGLKKVARLSGLPGRLQKIGQTARQLGQNFVIAPFHLEEEFSTGLVDRFSRIVPGAPTKGQEGIVFLGGKSYLDEALALESDACEAVSAAALYGYPECCARAYERHLQTGAKLWLNLFLENVENGASLPWQMNRAGRLFAPHLSLLPDYFPCSVRCAESSRLATLYGDLLCGQGFGPLLELARRHLARPLLVYRGCLYWLKVERRGGNEIMASVLACHAFGGKRLACSRLRLRQEGGELLLNERGVGDAEARLVFFC